MMPVSAAPETANIEVYQGDDFGAVVDVFDPEGLPADLTGYTPLAQLRRFPNAANSPYRAHTLEIGETAAAGAVQQPMATII